MSTNKTSIHTIGVIVGRDLIGDALMKLPFVRALKNAFPAAQIAWITSNGPTAYAGMLKNATAQLIDRVYETPDWAKEGAGPGPMRVDAPHFDLLIDTRNRRRLVAGARHIPHGVFLAMAARGWASDIKPPVIGSLINKPPHLVDRLLQLVELAAGFKPPVTGALSVPAELAARARLILPPGRIYVGLAPGAGNRIKIWSRLKFEQVAREQTEKNRVPVFILGPQEAGWIEELRRDLPMAHFPLQQLEDWGTTQLSVDHTLALAQRLDIAVANDSGVGHMLAAADCKLISLFGPTSAAKLAPRVSKGIVIRAQDFGSAQMTAIPVAPVLEAIERLLAE